ncbi:hypothetical protein GWK08_13125 [Leptobacterium flavescens]|uniref:PcfJ-like protein n=1 Tax=Leptobacterium flavescens TaxID=472055 RepID=A0A6P0URI1_9FLAO|nr:PcfJ domain-containing protein [Leptobacterium flavescens]NER14389.1 hypothetical protein [Leptobacterium flavescens]
MKTHRINNKKLDKILAEKKREKEISEALKKHNKRKKVPFVDLVEDLYKNGDANNYKEYLIAQLIAPFFKKASKNKYAQKRNIFKKILIHMYEQKCFKLLMDKTNILILFNISWHHHSFIRPFEEWIRKSHNDDRQIISLLNHCFVTYYPPEFIYYVWGKDNYEYMQWFIDISRGVSVRSLSGIPIGLTKKIACEFLKAPTSYTVEMALRRAQCLSMGGNERLAQYIAFSRLSRNDFEQESFWEQVIRFFVRQNMFDYQKLDELFDYLNHMINQNENYTIKGRTLASLSRQSDTWHEEVYGHTKLKKVLRWERSNINSFSVTEGKNEDAKAFYIYELVDSRELMIEGRKMNHCVLTYANSCRGKRSAIFTLRKKEVLSFEAILATIEVDLYTRTIVQAKAKFNRKIHSKAFEIMEKWASQEALGISKWL